MQAITLTVKGFEGVPTLFRPLKKVGTFQKGRDILKMSQPCSDLSRLGHRSEQGWDMLKALPTLFSIINKYINPNHPNLLRVPSNFFINW